MTRSRCGLPSGKNCSLSWGKINSNDSGLFLCYYHEIRRKIFVYRNAIWNGKFYGLSTISSVWKTDSLLHFFQTLIPLFSVKDWKVLLPLSWMRNDRKLTLSARQHLLICLQKIKILWFRKQNTTIGAVNV